MKCGQVKDVVAIVVTYNRKAMLLECVEHLLQQQNAHADILVVDNASTDGTAEALQELINDSKVFYCNTGANLGGAGGFQFGVIEAIRRGYKYLWLMDDDVNPAADCLEALLRADKELNGQYGFLSSVAKWRDGSVCRMNIQKTALNKKIEDYSSPIVPVIMATFVSFFFKAETAIQFGLPIKEFFIWADDLEYSRRISLKMPCYVVTDSLVLHNMASNNKVGIESESDDRLWRYEYLYRNEVYLYSREGIRAKLYLFLRVILHITRVIFKARESKRKKISVIFGSYRKGFKFKPEIEFYSDQGVSDV